LSSFVLWGFSVKVNIQRITALFIALGFGSASHAAITGSVFQDANHNGTRETTATAGSGVGLDTHMAGVTINVYDSSGALAGTAASVICLSNAATDNARDATGSVITSVLCQAGGAAGANFSITPTGSAPYKVEFVGYVSPLRPSFAGGSATQRDNVQIATTANDVLSFGLVAPTEYCQNNPSLISPCFGSGDAQPLQVLRISITH
jgi:hypothetical protein